MKGAMKIAEVRNVPISIHWTFLLLLGLIGVAVYSLRQELLAVAYAIFIILVIFLIVLLHELAHVAVAHRFGVPTKEITLHPLGGISMMERMPEKPKQEALVAVAGPLVNVGLAVVFGVLLARLEGWPALVHPQLLRLDEASLGSLVRDMFWLNILMGAFNLLPAFPMDGGRVLRSILAIRMSYVRATSLAANAGRLFGILFALVGLFFLQNIFLMLIGVFVYFGASSEERAATTSAVFEHADVGEAMRREVQTVSPSMPVADIVELSYRTHQMDLPVVEAGRYLGLVDRSSLASALGAPGARAEDIMREDAPLLFEDEDLATAFRKFSNSRLKALPVFSRDGHDADEEPSPEAQRSWAPLPVQRPRAGSFIGMITIEDMERAYLYITQRESLGADSRLVNPLDFERKRRLPRARNTQVARGGKSGESEDWVPVSDRDRGPP